MPLPRLSRYVGWFLLTGALALIAGGLFQAAGRTGAGLFRMFATFTLVLTGLAAVQVLRLMFAYLGRRHVTALLGEKGLAWLENVRLLPGVPPAQFVVLGPSGVLALTVDAYEPAFTTWGKRAQDQRAARQAQRLAHALMQRVGSQLPPGLQVQGAVLTLRRKPVAAGRGSRWAVDAMTAIAQYLPAGSGSTDWHQAARSALSG